MPDVQLLNMTKVLVELGDNVIDIIKLHSYVEILGKNGVVVDVFKSGQTIWFRDGMRYRTEFMTE